MKKRLIKNCVHDLGATCAIRPEPCTPCSHKDNDIQLHAKDIPTVRNNILTYQNNQCKICGNSLKISDSNACLDHSHTRKNKGTGLVRGVLCRNCNTYIAKLENFAGRCGIQNVNLPTILIEISSYLTSQQYRLIHPTEKPKEKKLKKDSFNRLIKVMKACNAKKIPEYPRSGKLTSNLEKVFDKYKIKPEFYK